MTVISGRFLNLGPFHLPPDQAGSGFKVFSLASSTCWTKHLLREDYNYISLLNAAQITRKFAVVVFFKKMLCFSRQFCFVFSKKFWWFRVSNKMFVV